MIRFTALAIFALSLAPTTAVHAEPAVAPVLSDLIGAWEGEGKLFGQPATFSAIWEWTLDRRFVRLTFENRIVTDGQPRTVLRATAYYRPDEAEPIKGVWFDTRGEILELEARSADSELRVHWRSASEQGRTTYGLTTEGTVEVRDHVLNDEGWRLFGSATLERSGPG